MKPIKNILLPTDLSDLGQFAYDLAVKVAFPTKANIHVLSVVPAPANAVFDSDGNMKTDEGDDLSQLEKERSDLQDRLEKWAGDKPRISGVRTKIGRVDEDILQYAEKNGIDLIVMGTAGAKGVTEWLQGSHAEKIVRNAEVPVLTLKCDRSTMVIKDMLLVSDFHHPETLDLSMVKSLQQAFGARLNLLKINTPKDFEPTRRVMLHMQQFAELNGLEDVAYHLYCDETVEKGIIHFSSDTGIDFLAIGTHQRKGMGRLFRHSISEDVVNHIWQPILTFKV